MISITGPSFFSYVQGVGEDAISALFISFFYMILCIPAFAVLMMISLIAVCFAKKNKYSIYDAVKNKYCPSFFVFVMHNLHSDAFPIINTASITDEQAKEVLDFMPDSKLVKQYVATVNGQSRPLTQYEFTGLQRRYTKDCASIVNAS